VSFVRVPPIANLCPRETPIYKQLKIRFTIYVHLKVPHDTPPLRRFGSLVSFHLQFYIRWPLKHHFYIPHFWATWTPVLGRILPTAAHALRVPAIHLPLRNHLLPPTETSNWLSAYFSPNLTVLRHFCLLQSQPHCSAPVLLH
jgi:hypothetical protein